MAALVCTARVALLADDQEKCARLIAEAIDHARVGWRQPLGRRTPNSAFHPSQCRTPGG